MEGRVEGRVEEARRLLLKVLAARIDREFDIARLEAWFELSVTANSLSDVFRDR